MYLIYVNNDVNLVNGKIMLIYTNREKCGKSGNFSQFEGLDCFTLSKYFL